MKRAFEGITHDLHILSSPEKTFQQLGARNSLTNADIVDSLRGIKKHKQADGY